MRLVLCSFGSVAALMLDLHAPETKHTICMCHTDVAGLKRCEQLKCSRWLRKAGKMNYLKI